MPDGNEKEKNETSGGTESFWSPGYKPDRYVEPDGTTVPLYDQVMIEETCRTQRFDPGEAADKRYWKKGGA